MSSLACHAMRPVPYLSIQNDAVADSRAQCQHAERINTESASAAQDAFSQSGYVGIALHGDRYIQTRFNLGAQLKSIPSGQIWRIVQAACRDRKSTRLNSSHVKISY